MEQILQRTKKREKCHFIRLGVLAVNSPRKIEMQKDSDGRMIVIPPRLNGLRIKQQSFRQCTEQYKWDYLLEDDADEDHKDEDNGVDDEDDKDVDNKDSSTSSPTTSNKKRKYNAVMGMITPGDGNITANLDMAKSYPYLSRALIGEDSFDLTNPSVQKSMHSLLNELNRILSWQIN